METKKPLETGVNARKVTIPTTNVPTPTNFYLRLLKVAEGLDYLQKDKKNEHQKYRYVSEAKIKEAVRRLFIENMIFFNYSSDEVSTYEISPTANGTKQFVTTVKGGWKMVDALNPSAREEGRWIGTGTDTGDKGLYKAITGGIKYVLNTNFLIPTGDDPEKDDDENIVIPGKKPMTTGQVNQILSTVSKKNVSDEIKKQYGISSTKNLTSGKKDDGNIITESDATDFLKALFTQPDKTIANSTPTNECN